VFEVFEVVLDGDADVALPVSVLILLDLVDTAGPASPVVVDGNEDVLRARAAVDVGHPLRQVVAGGHFDLPDTGLVVEDLEAGGDFTVDFAAQIPIAVPYSNEWRV
jgi:hypothetical protein